MLIKNTMASPSSRTRWSHRVRLMVILTYKGTLLTIVVGDRLEQHFSVKATDRICFRTHFLLVNSTCVILWSSHHSSHTYLWPPIHVFSNYRNWPYNGSDYLGRISVCGKVDTLCLENRYRFNCARIISYTYIQIMYSRAFRFSKNRFSYTCG